MYLPNDEESIKKIKTKIDKKTKKVGDCLVWQGATRPSGGRVQYPCIKVGGKVINCHRLLWEIYYGPLTLDLYIKRTCRNSLCLNPEHLQCVTKQEFLESQRNLPPGGLPWRDGEDSIIWGIIRKKGKWGEQEIKIQLLLPHRTKSAIKNRIDKLRRSLWKNNKKLCFRCRKIKPIQKFPKRGTVCFQCHKYRDYEWNIKRKYDLSIEDYKSLLSQSNGLCPICLRNISDDSKIRACVDHNHSTGEIRGVICLNCNMGLGSFYDNPETLKKAILYLEPKDPL